jgi:hypothetical protein
MTEAERKRLERLRRALLNVVAQLRNAYLGGRYTLSIVIVPRDQPSQKSASSAGLAAPCRPAVIDGQASASAPASVG